MGNPVPGYCGVQISGRDNEAMRIDWQIDVNGSRTTTLPISIPRCSMGDVLDRSGRKRCRSDL